MLTRRGCLVGGAATLAGLGFARTAPGQGGSVVAWTRVPSIAIVGTPGDARVRLVHDAIAFWNSTLARIGSGFRLGPAIEIAGTVPLAELSALSDAVLGRTGPVAPPASVLAISGNIVI